MAYPWTFYSNFDSAALSTEWTSESDTGSLLNRVNAYEIANDPNSLMPYRGAYVLENKLGDTNDHTVTSTTIAQADANTSYYRWYMGLSRDFRFTADDTFNVFELQQSGGTREISVGFRVTNSTQLIEFGIGDGSAPTTFVHWPGRQKWVAVELLATISTGGSGVVTLYLDGTQVLTLTSQTHAAAIGQGVLGSQDTLSTTLGAIYYDDFIMDDARIYPYRERFPFGFLTTKTSHLFVGPGYIESAVLYTITGGDESLSLYDTDTGNINDTAPVCQLNATGQTSVGGPLYFERGCYCVMGGTDPVGQVHFTRSNEKLGVKGPVFYSNWGLRYWGQNRKQRPGNV